MEIYKISHEYSSGFKLEVKNLKFEKNKIYGLVGHNGAGKTTLMSILAGILKPNIMDDYEVEKVNPVYIPSEIRLYDFITVSEFIDIYLKYSNSKFEKEEILEILEMEDKADISLEELSMGLKKRISLIPWIAGEGDFIILDEPFNGIDYKYIEKLKKIIDKREATYLISSHMIDTLVDICDEIIEIEDGINKRYEAQA